MEVIRKQLSVEETLDSIFELLERADEMMARVTEIREVWEGGGIGGEDVGVLRQEMVWREAETQVVDMGLEGVGRVRWEGVDREMRVTVVRMVE